MAKSKKQKNIAWIKMPVNLMDDERIAELVAQKGMTGLGTYIAIIGELYRRQCRCLTVTQLKALKFSGVSKKAIVDVVEKFALFRKDKSGHVYSVIDFLGFEDEDKIVSDADENAFGIESHSFPSPARVYKDKDIDKDKDHHHDGADFILQIPEHSEWTDVALMKSGFAELVKRNWQVTLDLFRTHAIANCTIGKISSVDDAKRYFHFYITNPTSGNLVRKALEEYERQHPQKNPYRFEDVDSVNGHRSYHGIPIPDNAPPRPDERSDWDYENECWISPTNFNQKK